MLYETRYEWALPVTARHNTEHFNRCAPVVLNIDNPVAYQLDEEDRPVLRQAVVPLDRIEHVPNLRQTIEA